MFNKILITGAGSGIGKETAFALAKRHHHVIATTQSEEQAAELMREAQDKGIKIDVKKLDILDPSDRARANEWEVDTLINNAAVGESGPLVEIPMDRVRANFETNVFASLSLTQIVAKKMLAKKRGRIYFMSSIAGRMSFPFLAPYCMTKFALEAASEAMRKELEPHGISVSIIEPGPYQTGFNEKIMAKKNEWLKSDSYFSEDTLLITKSENIILKKQYGLESIVKLITKAVEAKYPKSRYVAPLKYKLIIYLKRLLGN